MNCQVCGKPASIHLTEVQLSGEKTQAHYCLDHAEQSGIPSAQMQDARTRQAALIGFLTFVRTNRRVPTPDELHQIGLLDAEDRGSEQQVELWKRRAEAILAADDQ